MELRIVGCTGSLPGPQSPASCYLLTAHDGERDWRLLLDLGPGALGQLQRHCDPDALDGVVLSHLHPDHCLDVCALHVWRRHGPRPVTVSLPVWGPPGVADRLARAYGVSEAEPLSDMDFHELADRAPFTLGPFTITPFAVAHPVPAFGLRVEAGGRVLAYTGDTDTCQALVPLLAGADLALVECGFGTDEEAPPGIHLTARRAGRAAAAASASASVGRLVLTHLPPWVDAQACLEAARAEHPGEVEVVAAGGAYPV